MRGPPSFSLPLCQQYLRGLLLAFPICTVSFAQFKRRVELIETGKNGTKDIYKALASGTIRLLSAEYVRHQGSSFRVERYQDLLEKEKSGVHPSPFVPKEKAVKLLKDGQVACMSYRSLPRCVSSHMMLPTSHKARQQHALSSPFSSHYP
jgi:hypothetical protein